MNFFIHYGFNNIQQKIEFIDIDQENLKKIRLCLAPYSFSQNFELLLGAKCGKMQVE